VLALDDRRSAIVNPSNLQSAVANLQCKAPIDDIRSTARYRARVATNLFREFLAFTKAG
jgi:xanthine dehydrogenase iron-sulfur cluster and FAD-binding subunit A